METGAREKTTLRLNEGQRAQKQGDKTKFTNDFNKESSWKEKKIIQKYFV